MVRIALCTYLIFVLYSCGVTSSGSFYTIPITMGEDTVCIVEYNSDSLSNVIYLNVHEDEQTSIEVLKKAFKKEKINFFYLNHSGSRRIVFHAQGREYSVDPNRIYTDTGRRKTMDDGGHFSPLGNIIVSQLAEEIQTRIQDKNWIITLHNNTPNEYSILSYLPGGDEAENAKKVFVNPKMDSDDFIYTTSEEIYSKMEQAKVNVILQDNISFVDDGSLSIYCGIEGKSYVNIETEHGHFKQQIKLLKKVSEFVNGE